MVSKFLTAMSHNHGFEMPREKDRAGKFVSATDFVRGLPLKATVLDLGTWHATTSRRQIRSMSDFIGGYSAGGRKVQPC